MNMLEDHQTRQNVHKGNFKIKCFILSLLSITIIVVSVILCRNYFDIIDQGNIYAHKDEHNSIEIQNQENIKRILIDTQINRWNVNDQTNPKVSTLSDGNYVVVWQSYLEVSIGFSIYGQIFYSNGAKKGNEFRVSNFTALNETNPNVAALSNGKFMVI